MKALVLYGSPRKNGNTTIILKEIVNLLVQKKVDYEEIFLDSVNGNACIGCNFCKKESVCRFQDDYTEIITKLINSDLIIIGTPVYFGGVTSQLKKLIDRFQVLYNNRDKIGRKINIFLVTVGAENNPEIFGGIKLTLKYLKLILQSEKCEIICIQNAEERKKIDELINTKELKSKICNFVNK